MVYTSRVVTVERSHAFRLLEFPLYLIRQWFCESVDRFKGVYMVFATCIHHHWLADSPPLEESLVRVTQGCEECTSR